MTTPDPAALVLAREVLARKHTPGCYLSDRRDAAVLARALLDAQAESERLHTGLRNLKAAGEQAEDARSLYDLLTNEIDALLDKRTP